ncbi:small ribosomal subunit protein bS16m-like [Ptychodera flava]|uniref:small ribosomal subunit protein bS16m-like n=1 Tax=Ptychodera flava TaxID=63121 RepID=UPI003969F7F8
MKLLAVLFRRNSAVHGYRYLQICLCQRKQIKVEIIMVMRIRLALHGCTNRPFFHIVVMPHIHPRNYPPREQIGTYDPMPNKHNEQLVAINFERLKYWMAQGAILTKPVAKLIGLSGFLPVHPMSYVDARRARMQAEKQAESAEATATEIHDDDDT